MAIIRIFVNLNTDSLKYILITIVSSSLVLFMWVLFKTELTQYIREAHKHESYARIGLNAGNFIHNMHLATAQLIVYSGLSADKSDDRKGITKAFTSLKLWIDEKVKMRQSIMAAINANRTSTPEEIDIHQTIEAVITTLYFDQTVYKKIDTLREFQPSGLVIKAVPFEIYYILQNIMSNSVEAMLRTAQPTGRKKHALTIKTRIARGKMIITISDTGPGFPVEHGKIILKSDNPTGGYGTRYIQALIKNYHGDVHFYNNKQGGAAVELHFPQKGNIKIFFQG